MKKNRHRLPGRCLTAAVVFILMAGCGLQNPGKAPDGNVSGGDAPAGSVSEGEASEQLMPPNLMEAVDTEETPGVWDMPGAGIRFTVPQEFTDAKGGIRQSGGEELVHGEGVSQTMVYYIALTEEQYDALMLKRHLSEMEQANYQQSVLPLFLVYGINGGRDENDLKSYLENYYHNELSLDLPVNLTGIKKVGAAGDYTWYLVPSAQSLTLADGLGDYKEEFLALYENMDSYEADLSFYEPVGTDDVLSAGAELSFVTTDLEGNTVSSDELFSENRVTMLVVWSSWNSPCIWSLPWLEELDQKAREEDCAIVGMLSADTDEEDLAEAREALGAAGVDFLNLLPPDNMEEIIPVQATPITWFVDRSGKIIGDPLNGARRGDYEKYLDNAISQTEAVIREPFEITLAFAGDINFDDSWSVMAHLHEMGDRLSDAIDEDYLTAMREADLFWVNNEFTYSDRGAPLPGKAFTFRSAPENVNYLEEMGADIAGLANNHVYDYGEEAFYDTLDTLTEAGIPYVGAGRDLKEAASPVYLTAKGVRIAYVAASRAEMNILTREATEDGPGILRCYDNTRFLESIREADQNADFVVALPHWGTEYSTDLQEAQVSGARAYIEAGADAVIGAHTHCLQGVSTYRDKPIAYSLGNFWFNNKTLDTMLYELHLTGVRTIGEGGEAEVSIDSVQPEILPGVQSGCVTTMAEGEEAEAIRERIESLPKE